MLGETLQLKQVLKTADLSWMWIENDVMREE